MIKFANTEKIVGVYVKTDKMCVSFYAPKMHYDCINKMIALGEEPPIKGEEGFVTNLRTYLPRRDAAKLALKNGQVEKLSKPPNLYWEDLWESEHEVE